MSTAAVATGRTHEELRAAYDRWTRAQIAKRRNSREYRQAYAEMHRIQREWLATKKTVAQ